MSVDERESAGQPDTARPTLEEAGVQSDPLLGGPEVAERIGVSPGTWRSLIRDGYTPPPDEPDAERSANARRPKWRASTIDAWQAARPGRGKYARRHVVPFSGELR